MGLSNSEQMYGFQGNIHILVVLSLRNLAGKTPSAPCEMPSNTCVSLHEMNGSTDSSVWMALQLILPFSLRIYVYDLLLGDWYCL